MASGCQDWHVIDNLIIFFLHYTKTWPLTVIVNILDAFHISIYVACSVAILTHFTHVQNLIKISVLT